MAVPVPSSEYYDVLTKYATELTTAFSKSPVSISDKLLNKGIISNESHERVTKEIGCSTPRLRRLTGSQSSAKEKAKELVSCLLRHIQEKPELFQDLQQFLEEDVYFKDITKKLKAACPHSSIPQNNPVTNLQHNFDSLVSECLASLESQGISPQTLANSIQCIKLFADSHDSKESLVVDCNNDIAQASSNAAIFELVKPYMSFLNPELLDNIIEKLGSDDDCKKFKDYMKGLEEYCKITQVVLPCQLQSDSETAVILCTDTTTVTVTMNLKKAHDLKKKISSLLKLNDAAFQIYFAGRPPPTISFQIPNFACEKVFPLTSEQKSGLRAMEVGSLKCGEYSCGFTEILVTWLNWVGDEAEKEIEKQSLGRPFDLGMFYDCQKDNLISGERKICPDDVIESCLDHLPQKRWIGKIIPSDTLSVKAQSLGLTPSLKLSLLAGFVRDISGAALYWNELTTSKNKIRICLLFENIKCVKLLPVEKLLQHFSNMKQHLVEGATHVVTKIVYGFGAYFIIECDVEDGETHEKVHDEIGGILTANGLAGDPLKMGTRPKPLHGIDLVKRKVVCTVLSDTNPTMQQLTLEAGIQMFQSFVQQASNGAATDEMIPKTVTLFPLKILDNRYNSVVRPISSKTVQEVQSMMESINDLVMQVNDLQNTHKNVTSKFQYLGNQLEEFREKLLKYKSATIKSIGDQLSHVRDGSVEETDLISVIKESKDTPFDLENLQSWLEQKHEEASAISLLVNKLEGIDFASSKEVESLSTESDYHNVVCFAFNIGSAEDLLLKNMELYNDFRFEQNFSPLHKCGETPGPLTAWYKDSGIKQGIHNEADKFKQFYYANQAQQNVKFVVTSNTLEDCRGALTGIMPGNIVLYKNGTARRWEPPGPPGKPVAVALSHNSVRLEWSKPDCGSENVECYTISYHSNVAMDDETKWKKWTTNSAEVCENITELHSNVNYVFKVQAQCGFAVSYQESALSNSVTMPSGIEENIVLPRPQKPSVTNITHNSVWLKWDKPDCASEKIDGYTIFYCSPGGSHQSWKRSFTKKTVFFVTELDENMSYVFKVRVELNGGGISKESEISDTIVTKSRSLLQSDINSVTLDTPENDHIRPGKPKATTITHDSISLEWTPPMQNADDIQLYIVSYRQLNDPDDTWYKHSENNNATSITVRGLSADAEYIFKVRPEFKTGTGTGPESKCSNPIKTKFLCQPGRPKSIAETISSIHLQWEPPEYGSETVVHYVVSCHLLNQDGKTRYSNRNTKGKAPSLIVNKLKPKCLYTFKVFPVVNTSNSHCVESPWSEKIKTSATSCPLKVSCSSVTHESISIKWSKPTEIVEEIVGYSVFYQQNDSHSWQREASQETNKTIHGLSLGTTYTFKVQPHCRSGWLGTESICTKPTETKATSLPGIPVLNSSLPITHDSIPLQWTEPEHGCENINQYVIRYHVQNERGNVLMKFTTGRETKIVVNELRPNVKYRFSVQCECIHGIGATGQWCWNDRISTKPSSAPGKPSVLNEQVTNKKVQNLKWTQPKFGTENIKNYTVYARKSLTDHWHEVAKTNGTETECAVDGLDSNTEYVFRVCPECGKYGSGCASDETDPVKTKPTSAPKNVQTRSKYTTHDSIQLSWKQPDKYVRSITSYTILYCREQESNAEWNVYKYSVSQQSVTECISTINELCANTSYLFKVRPECSAGSGTESAVIGPEKTRPVCQCGKPKPISVTHDSITWEWTKPSYDSENVLYYMVWSKQHSDEAWLEKEMKYTKGAGLKIKIDKLVSNTAYNLKVLPHMQSGNSTGCEHIQSDPVTTKAISPPGKPTATIVTHDTIHLEWTKPTYVTDKIMKYCVEYWCTDSKDRHVIQSTTTQEHLLVKELAPGTRYAFCIKPESNIGEGASSEPSKPIMTKATSAPGKPEVIKVTHNSVHLEWTKPDVGYVTSYSVICTNLCSQVEMSVTASENNAKIDSLEPRTQYIFKIEPNYGINLGTKSDSSDVIVTKQVCKAGKPTPLNITHDSILLQWHKPEFIGSGRIEYYSVSYWHEGGIKHDVTTIGTLEEVTLQSLSTNKEYYCEVTPNLRSDEDIPCVPSVSDPIRTKSTSEPGKPIAVRRTHDSIELQWTKPKHGSENVEYYVVRYRLINEVELNRCPGLKLSVSECDKPTQSMKIDTLEANSKYVFQVHPDCKHGSKGTDSCFSDPISTTCTSLPGNIKPLVVTHNSIKLHWTKPIYGSEKILHYIVSYCAANEHKEANPKWIKTEKTTADETQITLTGLSTRTNYFFKVHPECTNGDGAVYECTEPTEMKATSPPGQPQCVSLTHNSIRLKWTIPEHGSENIESYTVSYYPQEHPEQIRQKPSASNKMEVHTLRSNAAYLFKVHPECSHGTSTESPVSEPIMTQPCCQPEKVFAKPANVTHSSIRIEWTKPEFGNVESYLVKCYQERERKNEIAEQTIDSFSKLCAEFKSLQPKTWYMFKVTPQCSADMEKIGIESTCSEPIETSNRPLAERMRSKSLCISTGSPVIYKVPVHYVMKDQNNKIAKCYIGDPPKEPVPEKILMVVGATGAGKTTLINGITNHIFNVQWENNFRFKLIIEDDPRKDQSRSQTSWITAYTFYPIEGSCINYTLTIIDTPGFGDCEGVQRDKRITNQIQEFLFIPPPHDVNEIHGIGFVTQSSLARLTPTQKYIFDSILAIFGRDIAENIFLMCTFADGQLPPVLNAVKAAKVPGTGGEKKHFKFNNSALFAEVDETNEMNFDQMFWKMGKQSFESFFKDFQAAPCQSLQLTKEVMMDRQHLEILVERFHQQIKMGLSKIDELQQEEQVLKNHQEDIEANKNFIFEVKVIKFKEVQLDEGKYVTNCTQCKLTCHADCTIKEDDEKYKCRAMGWFWQKTKDAHCKVCPGKCHWEQHVNKEYYYVPEEVPEKRTLEDLKTKYEQAVGGKTRAEQMISKNEQDLEDLRSAVLELVREMKEKQERLQEIALKPNPLSEESYIEILIESEKQEAATGFEKRVASLEMIKKEVKLLSRANTASSREDMRAVRGKSWWEIWKEYFKTSI